MKGRGEKKERKEGKDVGEKKKKGEEKKREIGCEEGCTAREKWRNIGR